MKKAVFFCLIALMGTLTLQAQQFPLYQQYLANEYYLNPAHVGKVMGSPIKLTFRKELQGFEDAPRVMAVTYSTRLTKERFRRRFVLKNPWHGVGGQLFSNTKGPISHVGMRASYAYHIPMEDASLSFGLTAEFSKYGINYDDLEYVNQNDDAITESQANNEKKNIFDADFGVWLVNPEKYYAGFTAGQLIRPMIKLAYNDTAVSDGNRLMAHTMMARAGYMLTNKQKNVIFEPNGLFMMRLAKPSPEKEYHLNMRVSFVTLLNNFDKERISLTASYRSNQIELGKLNSVYLSVDFSLNEISMGYAYEHLLTDYKQYTKGSHLLHLGYTIQY